MIGAEVRVDLSDYVPEGFGTCDCVMIGGDTLEITDFKFGQGVPVSAHENPQMRLYALGALKTFAPFYGPAIKKITMTIVQPRVLNTPDSETITVESLYAWGARIKPIAEIAFNGLGEYVPGEHCRFCRGKERCKARADRYLSLEQYATRPISAGFANALTNDEIASIIERGSALAEWYKDITDYALSAILRGEDIPGYKAVAGKSNRTWADEDAAISAILSSGWDEAMVFKTKAPHTLSELEKLMGKEKFTETVGKYVIKPLGKPTLAPLSDKREPYSALSVEEAFGNENNKFIKENS